MTTLRKVLHTRMDVSAGKMTRQEMSNPPTNRSPRTSATAVSPSNSVLYSPAYTPVAGENVSSNVSAKIFWKKKMKSISTTAERTTLSTTSSSLIARMLPNI